VPEQSTSAVQPFPRSEAMDELSLSGRVAVVTGGSRGIGRSIAEKLAERGAAVAVMFREHEAPAREFEAAARAKGGVRLVSCLEGGYNLRTLGATIRAHVAALE